MIRSIRLRPCWCRLRFRRRRRSLGVLLGRTWTVVDIGLTELVVEAVVGARAVGTAALGHCGHRGSFRGSGNDADGSGQCNETGSE